MAAPYSRYRSSFRTTLPRRSKRTTLRALNKEPIPCKRLGPGSDRVKLLVANHQSHIFVVIEGVEDVVGQAAQQVNDEPRLEVVHANHLGIAHHLPALAHECGVKV